MKTWSITIRLDTRVLPSKCWSLGSSIATLHPMGHFVLNAGGSGYILHKIRNTHQATAHPSPYSIEFKPDETNSAGYRCERWQYKLDLGNCAYGIQQLCERDTNSLGPVNLFTKSSQTLYSTINEYRLPNLMTSGHRNVNLICPTPLQYSRVNLDNPPWVLCNAWSNRYLLVIWVCMPGTFYFHYPTIFSTVKIFPKYVIGSWAGSVDFWHAPFRYCSLSWHIIKHNNNCIPPISEKYRK